MMKPIKILIITVIIFNQMLLASEVGKSEVGKKPIKYGKIVKALMGQKIKVKTFDGKVYKGILAQVDSKKVTLIEKDGNEIKVEIFKIKKMYKPSGIKKILGGAALGFGCLFVILSIISLSSST